VLDGNCLARVAVNSLEHFSEAPAYRTVSWCLRKDIAGTYCPTLP
jgi:hypothetical protein